MSKPSYVRVRGYYRNMHQAHKTKWKCEQGSLKRQPMKSVTVDSESPNYLTLLNFPRLFHHIEKEWMKSCWWWPIQGARRAILLYESLQFDRLLNCFEVSYCTAGELQKMKNIYFYMCSLCRECRPEVLEGNTSAQDQHKMKLSSSFLPLDILKAYCFGRFQPSSNI